LIAFILNFFIPGVGTFFVGRFGTAIIQLALLPVGVLLIPFSGIGVLVLVGDWVWGLLTVVQAWRKPGVVYVRQDRRR
jgi:TM2 domain-containing membrane protein YozV